MMRTEFWFVDSSYLDFLLLGRPIMHNDSHSGFRCFPFLSICPRLVVHIYLSRRTSAHKKGYSTPYETDVIENACKKKTPLA